MVTWRPVSGDILRLDPALASVNDIENFLAERRIPGRGAAAGEDGYRLELAVTGRRRRIAVLDDDGVPAPGPTLAEFVEEMDGTLRKLQIDMGGIIAWGDIDLGEVDVEGDDVDVASLQELERQAEAAAGEGAAEGAGDDAREVSGEDAAEDAGEEAGEDIPEFKGPMLVVSDIALAEMPGLAAANRRSLAVFRMEGACAVAMELDGTEDARRAGKPGFAIALSTDPSGLDAPVLSVRCRGPRLVWRWDDELEPVPWTKADAAASDFVARELGPGAICQRISQTVASVDAARIEEALHADPHAAPAMLVAALGLPSEIADFLSGLLSATAIPGAIVFEPKPLPQRIQTSVAYGSVGESKSKTGYWQAYRRLFVDRPRVTEIVSSIQAGVGSVLFAGGLRSWRRTGGKVAAAIGGALVVNAAARILTMQWIQTALETEGLTVKRAGAENEAAEDAEVEDAKAKGLAVGNPTNACP